ncbi:isochorismate synthase [Limosilactobacillus reuteri]|uniref:isochorismate synthase n=1 Tax=Limosilactobacillus reuteri TaxID=1598 RepID=UPI000B99C519|nr:isochorismate synthase [Limosilactobacillus reuteri]OYS57269.1 isochorismate synthase [Limosilactobacillus reuteri]
MIQLLNQVITKPYALYSYRISADLVQLCRQNQGYFNQQVFWQAADGKRTYWGIQPRRFLVGQSSAAIKKFQRAFSQQWQNLTPAFSCQPVLLGGFPFDSRGKRAPFWQQLEQGYFILPQILFMQDKERTTVSLLVPTNQEVRPQLVTLVDQVDQILARQIGPQPVPAVHGEELAVNEWLQLVNQSVTAIMDHRLKKVVLARQLQLTADATFNAAEILQRLIFQQENTYHLLVQAGNRTFVGASPERLLKADARNFTTASVAGSIRRGKTPGEDEQLGQQLLTDHKNNHEHQLVVERIQQVLAKYATAVTVGQQRLLKNRDIQHIYHLISGRRKPGGAMLDLLAALHPTPALGGEPRQAALAWLAAREPAGRGMYGGPVGWLGLGADEGEFAVGLRSGVFSQHAGLLYAGCGIVAGSVAAKERRETGLKFQPMLRGVSDQWIINKH